MGPIRRLAVYYAPRPGAFADRAAAWFVAGEAAQRLLPDLSLAQLMAGARRYGFHGTIRAPFRPASGVTLEDVGAHVAALAALLAPARCDGLRLANMHGFLALVPEGDEGALRDLAAHVVTETDALRAPLDAGEIARRRPETLSTRQRDLLHRWGYPYVMEEFRFHLTLTDSLPQTVLDPVAAALAAHFAPVLPQPFVVEDLCLFGEDAAGMFHLLQRHALCG